MNKIQADGSIVGVPQEGPVGIRETTDQIMFREQLNALKPPRPRPLRREFEHKRDNLPDNPNAPAVSRWPPKSRESGASDLTVTPSAPQTTSTTFLGATLADTGAFPPDTMGTVGPTQFIVAVNGRIRSFNKTTGVADGVLNAGMDTFFASVVTPPGTGEFSFTSDPRIRFDRLTDRWFVVIIDVTVNGSNVVTRVNRVLIAVSDGPNITGGTVWTFFQFQQDSVNPGIDAGRFADYPTLGIDANALYIGINVFDLAGTTFIGTSAFVIRKSSVLSGGPLAITAFRGLVVGTGAGPYTPQGCDNYDPTNTGPTATGYFIGVDNATFSTLVLRRVTNPAGATPTMSANISLTVPTTRFPITVPNQGGGVNVDALDDRLFAAHIRNGRLWTAHNINVTSAGVGSSSGTRDAVRWYELQNLGTTPSLFQSGTQFDNAASNPRFHFIPSIMVSGQGHAAMGCTVSGATQRLNAFTNGRLATDATGTLQAGVVYTASGTAYSPAGDTGNPRRWGDYSYTSLDPCDDMTMWTIQELMLRRANLQFQFDKFGISCLECGQIDL